AAAEAAATEPEGAVESEDWVEVLEEAEAQEPEAPAEGEEAVAPEAAGEPEAADEPEPKRAEQEGKTDDSSPGAEGPGEGRTKKPHGAGSPFRPSGPVVGTTSA